MANIKELSEKYDGYIIEQRRHFHQHPELSLQEVNTTADIIARLKAIDGIEVQTYEGLTGCVGILKGAKPGKTVVLRADIDGLPVKEQTGLPFASENPGKMHACGHDCHISMQLGAAKILSELKNELSGTVKFFFQPAEEVAQGAKQYIAKGLMKDVDAVFGMHIWSQVDAPHFSMQHSERMASADAFTLTVKGKAAHGSAPHLGSDAIVAAAAIIMNLQSICSRANDPLNALVVTIGTFDGGQRFNIIADKVSLDGTVRTFSRTFRDSVEERIRSIAEQTAACYGCTAELQYNYLCNAIINDNTELVDMARNAATKLFGDDILFDLEKLTGSEDFSFLMDEAPGIYGFLGARSDKVPGSELSNHHECFTVDENALHHGAAISAQFAYDFLNR
ncbi:putative hydrolase YxeP [anaerobic digester metagenome]